MIRNLTMAALLAAALAPALPAAAQVSEIPPLAGTRLDVTATGEVSRVPDIVRITAGVATQAPTAADALRQNAERMERVRAALARAGIADRDVQTLSLELGPVYRNGDYDRAEVIGYRAANALVIRFRQVSAAGPVLDALVAQGVTQINGPMLGFDHPEAALDEARTLAIGNARARADLYARALGMRVKRVVFVNEEGADQRPVASGLANMQSSTPVSTAIDPGGRNIQASVTVVFELE